MEIAELNVSQQLLGDRQIAYLFTSQERRPGAVFTGGMGRASVGRWKLRAAFHLTRPQSNGTDDPLYHLRYVEPSISSCVNGLTPLRAMLANNAASSCIKQRKAKEAGPQDNFERRFEAVSTLPEAGLDSPCRIPRCFCRETPSSNY